MEKNIVIVRPNNQPTGIDRILGLDQYEEGRFPGTKTGMPPFKFQNGNYRHGLADEKYKEDRKFIQDSLLNGEDLDSPTGRQFLANFLIELSSDLNFLDKTNPTDLLKYYCLKAAKDFCAEDRTDLTSNKMSYRQYVMEELGEDKREKVSTIVKVDRAKAKLVELLENEPYLIALAQYEAPALSGIKNADDAYLYLSDVLAGKYSDGSALKGVNRFESLLRVDMDEIMIAPIVKEAIKKNIIRKVNNKFINMLSKTELGNTELEVIQNLTKDEFQEELGLDTFSDKPYSIKAQLRSKNIK